MKSWARWKKLGVVGGRLGCLALLGCLAVGCGSEIYEQRLEETAKHWRYLAKLDANLAAKWSHPDGLFDVRVPRQFTEYLAPPKPKLDEEGNPVEPDEPVVDPRQPKFLDTELPGLVAAWKGKVGLASGKKTKFAPCYMYVLSNHDFWKENQQSEARAFSTDVSDLLFNALGKELPPPDQWDTPRYPAAKGYVKQKDFASPATAPKKEIGGVTTNFLLYLYQAGKEVEGGMRAVQVAVLFVIPSEIDSRREQFEQRIPLCLETLNVAEQLVVPKGNTSGRRRGL